MMSIDMDNVIVEVVKKAEDSDDTIIRLYEAYNRRCRVNMRFFKNIRYIVECDLMEKEVGENAGGMKVDGKEVSYEIKPFEIKTFKIQWED